MNPHRIKKVTVTGVTYEAIRLTGYGPIDKEIIEWIEEKTGRRPINLDTTPLGDRTIGLAYTIKPYVPYLICNGYSSLGLKKLKAGRWVVYNTTHGRINLMKNSEYDLLRNDEAKEKHERDKEIFQ